MTVGEPSALCLSPQNKNVPELCKHRTSSSDEVNPNGPTNDGPAIIFEEHRYDWSYSLI